MYREPTPLEIRRRIRQCKKFLDEVVLSFIYLSGCRVSEAVGRIYNSDDTTNYGIFLELDFQEYEGEEVALFNIKTAKRMGVPRIVALPLNSLYEPLTEKVVKYVQEREESPLFPLARQRLNRVAKTIFSGLYYPINDYKKNGVQVKRHWKPFRLHALRHLRTTELISFYGFTPLEAMSMLGWKLPGQLGAYLHLNWRSYYPKLLKPIKR